MNEDYKSTLNKEQQKFEFQLLKEKQCVKLEINSLMFSYEKTFCLLDQYFYKDIL